MSGTQRFPAPHRRASRLGSRTAQRWAGGFFLAALLFFSGTLVWAATVTRNQPKQERAAEVQPSTLTMPRKPVTKIVGTGKTTRPAVPKRIRTRIAVPKRPAAPARTSAKPSRSPSATPSRSPSVRPSPSTSLPPARFANCTELNKVYPDGVPAGHPAYERKHDRDGDGTACETD